MRKSFEYRSLAAAIFLSPWIYLILLLTMFFLSKDIGSTDQASSGLISIASGENAHILTAMWFLSALSILTLPLLILWQEHSVAGFERSGFLPLLLSSSMSEQMYRHSRVVTGIFVAAAISVLSALLGLMYLSALNLADHPVAFAFFTTAALVIYLPNLAVGISLAAYLSRISDRSIAVGIGLAAPLTVILLFGLLPRSIEASTAGLWLLAFEPTGTLYFSALQKAVEGAGWGSPEVVDLAPLLLNRIVVIMLATVLAVRYFRSPSSFEGMPSSVVKGRTLIRTSTNVSTLLLALLAIWLTVSNLQSNFSKNLQFYQIDPDMSFLVTTGLPDIQAFVIFALALLTGKLVWENKETGFSRLEMSSSLNGQRMLLRFLTQWSLLLAAFGLALVAAVAMMFGTHWADLDIAALAQYITIYLLPGLFLISMLILFLSIISPNRFVGYFATLVGAIAYLVATADGWLELPWSFFPAPFPNYSDVSGHLVFSSGTFSNTGIILAISLSFCAICMVLLGKERVWSATYLPKSTASWSIAFIGVAAIAFLIFVPAAERDRKQEPFLSPSPEMAARYEKAALDLPLSNYDLAAATIEISASENGSINLRSDFRVSTSEPTGTPIAITWGLASSTDLRMKVDGSPAGFKMPAQGLYLVEAPRTRSFTLTMEATLSLDASQAPFILDSFHGSWPTIPVLGVLPELFVRSESDRGLLGLSNEPTEMVHYHPDGLSRPAVPVTLIVRHPCGLTPALPWDGVKKIKGESCLQTVKSDGLTRAEFFVGLGEWSEANLTDDNGSLRILYPERYQSEARDLLDSTAVAREIVLDFMNSSKPLDLSLVTPPGGRFGRSNALSKPGVVFVSSTTILNTSIKGAELREREIGLMAHELMHQWYGHAVRPVTGQPGAIFVNELPAEFARAFALSTRGADAYERYLKSQIERYRYVVRTQARPDGAALTAVEVDEIYYRSSMLAHFLSTQLGWPEVMEMLADFAQRSAYVAPVTSVELLDALTSGLSKQAAVFARALVETDVVFDWDARQERLTARCLSTDCDGRSFLIPVMAPNGWTEWVNPADITVSTLSRSEVRHFTIGF